VLVGVGDGEGDGVGLAPGFEELVVEAVFPPQETRAKISTRIREHE